MAVGIPKRNEFLKIKKLGREIDCEGIHAALRRRRRRRQEEEGKIWGSLTMARQFGGWIMTSVSEGVNPIVLGGRGRGWLALCNKHLA